MTTHEILVNAKKASSALSMLDIDAKNKLLAEFADILEDSEDYILTENRKDVEESRDKISSVMIDRLSLDSKRIHGMADGIRDVVKLDDPAGIILSENERPNGLMIKKISVPFGVIGIIYESRPNVTSDAVALSLKSGNVCVLKCGKEAYRTSYAIVSLFRKVLDKNGYPESFVNILEDNSRQGASELMSAVGLVDLLIPRGGAGLIRACVENAKVPCIQTGTGICHIYVDDTADIEMALNIIENAKTSRPSVCNAAEVCLVAKSIAGVFLPALKKRLTDDRIQSNKIPVELRLDQRASEIIDGKTASEDDFDTEFLDYILAVKVVDGVKDAIDHISEHSTHHSEAIVTRNEENALLFTRSVDSSSVYVNASTRFTDGGEFGLGCEIGISTQKLHARGPMGLRELTTYKYVITGNGNVR